MCLMNECSNQSTDSGTPTPLYILFPHRSHRLVNNDMLEASSTIAPYFAIR